MQSPTVPPKRKNYLHAGCLMFLLLIENKPFANEFALMEESQSLVINEVCIFSKIISVSSCSAIFFMEVVCLIIDKHTAHYR